MLEIPLIALIDTLVERVEHTTMEPLVDEVPGDTRVSRVMTEFIDDSCPQKFRQLQADLLTLKRKATIVQETILQQNEELEGMRVVCAELVAKLTRVGEWLDSLVTQLEEYTLERQSRPLQAYINGACNQGFKTLTWIRNQLRVVFDSDSDSVST